VLLQESDALASLGFTLLSASNKRPRRAPRSDIDAAVRCRWRRSTASATAAGSSGSTTLPAR
jgi:hypothetical protein